MVDKSALEMMTQIAVYGGLAVSAVIALANTSAYYFVSDSLNKLEKDSAEEIATQGIKRVESKNWVQRIALFGIRDAYEGFLERNL